MTARFIVADVLDGLASLETGSVDVVITSPPFLALRSYLPADHELKSKEIGSEATPAEFIDTLLKVTAELRRVLAPHGSICVELGDTYAGSGGAGGDYNAEGLRDGQPKFRQQQPNLAWRLNEDGTVKHDSAIRASEPKNLSHSTPMPAGPGWPLAKSRTLIPSLYQIALAYGINPLTGQESPAGQWRIRNIVTWARPNPPVGALGDKWRPATSDLIIACTSGKRYWDDLATRKPFTRDYDGERRGTDKFNGRSEGSGYDPAQMGAELQMTHSGAPLLDYWVIPPGGYTGSHYAVFPEELVVPCVQAMCPQKVCLVCGEPSRRIVETEYEGRGSWPAGNGKLGLTRLPERVDLAYSGKTTGWSDCGHNNWRPGLVLDPFAGSGTTLAVATGHGHDAVGIDLDRRNVALARDRIGPLLFEEVDIGELQPDASP